jgi:hypothetical protein
LFCDFENQMQHQHMLSVPVLASIGGFLAAYALGIIFAFRRDDKGRRRKWGVLDFVWVPLGAVSGVCLLLLWWRNHGPM